VPRRGAVGRVGAAVREAGLTLRTVFTNPNLRRVQLAFVGSALGDWAYATAVTVWAYTDGGPAAVGIFQGVRFISAAVASPLGAVIADKVQRRTFMMVSDAIRAVLVVAATACVAFNLPSLSVYVLALICTVVGAPFRSAQAGLIPQLARTPEELTSSNATASNLENLASFAGPALGGVLIAVADVEVVFLLNAATFVWSLLLVSRIRVPRQGAPVSDTDAEAGAAPDDGERSGLLVEVSAGFLAIGKDRDLASVALLAGAQGVVWGALTVYMVVMSVHLLDAGAQGIGYLNSVIGVATVVGGVVVLSRVRHQSLGQDMAVGVLGWAVPLLVIAVWPSPVTVLVALAVIGLSDPMVNLGLDTIPQRIVPDRVLSRVFGAVEAALVGAMAMGAFVAPLLVSGLGFRGALLTTGAIPALIVLACFGRMRQLDHRLSVPDGLDLLRALPLFAPLGQGTQESLAHALRTRAVAAGEVVLREGDAADGFFIIESGLVEVTQGVRVLRREGPGEFFGEIGLLRDVPRTATVTAVEDTVLRELDRQSFLSAVSGHADARFAAEDIASRRLAV
jgi:MFS family permease